MDWADAIFPFDNHEVAQPFVRRIWRTSSTPAEQFISVAVPHWELVFTRDPSGLNVVLRGPESRASVADIPRDADFFGVQFELGTFMPSADLAGLADGAKLLPVQDEKAFWLGNERFEIPTFENADVFARHLAAREVLVADPLVQDVIARRYQDVSERTVQRRMLRATGLTPGELRQIERAERAAQLLRNGVPILDVVDAEGLSDQAHLTRSLRRFLGQTPLQIRTGNRARPRQ
ncbi:MAG: helix-turn-helix domain-containing protein [Porphyrobacter sp.]|nr:helix-turn-helix domain-containing protein [Porphyrobacter sp.]